jgi:hypothetical protein
MHVLMYGEVVMGLETYSLVTIQNYAVRGIA